MSKREINNDYAKIRQYAEEIGKLEASVVKKTHGTSTESNGGLTAKYSDMILSNLDEELKKNYDTLFNNTTEKLLKIAHLIEKNDKNASI